VEANRSTRGNKYFLTTNFPHLSLRDTSTNNEQCEQNKMRVHMSSSQPLRPSVDTTAIDLILSERLRNGQDPTVQLQSDCVISVWESLLEERQQPPSVDIASLNNLGGLGCHAGSKMGLGQGPGRKRCFKAV